MQTTTDISTSLLDWYWEYGSKRKQEWALARGSWLDSVLNLVEEAEAIRLAQTIYAKPTMALWGPSQSGKSTLLAKFIDHNTPKADGSGETLSSALCWGKTPALFSGDNQGGTVAVLNPYNQGADASGCVTRFQLKSSVKHPECPVEVHFATQQEMLLSLAVGYLSETPARNRNDVERHWQPGDLADVVKIATETCKTKTPDKTAFKLLIEVLNVVDILIEMEHARYINLKSEWSISRCNLLNNDVLVSDVRCVQRFAAELLWDSWPNLTDLYTQLSARCKELGGQTYYCSVEMAALLLNISAAQYYSSNQYVKDLVDSCSLGSLDGGDKALVRGSGGFFRGDIDFAITQGLVSLIVVPLKEEVIKAANEEVYSLLQTADLIDFPGVANEHKSADLLTDEKLALNYVSPEGKRPLLALTQVMKRGKTASIVVSSARNLNIDVFSLLVRMPAGQQYPAQPRQLMDGIRHWFKSMGQRHNPLDRSRALQINLILTFSATLLNLVNASGTGMGGLQGVFEKLRSMGDLAHPEVVNTFCVNYPMFPDGKIQIDSVERKEEVIKQILNDRFFRRQFDGTEDSLREMADLDGERYGGRLYLFQTMLSQMKKSTRQALLKDKMQKLALLWNERMAEALPGNDEASTRLADIGKVCSAVRTSSLPPQELSRVILNFENLDSDALEILPRRASGEYVEAQVNHWMEASKRKPLQTELGFENPEHRTRVLSYLRENICTKDLEAWLTELGRSFSKEERRECRRLVATFLVNQLFCDAHPHRSESESISLLNDMVGKPADNGINPFYMAVIEPFLSVMETLKTPREDRARGVQPGDEQLTNICANNTYFSNN